MYSSFDDKFVANLTVLAAAFQVKKAPLLVGAAFLTVIVASVIPIIRNADLNISGTGPFNQRAEVRMIVPALTSLPDIAKILKLIIIQCYLRGGPNNGFPVQIIKSPFSITIFFNVCKLYFVIAGLERTTCDACVCFPNSD